MRMDVALRNSIGEGTPVYSRWLRGLQTVVGAFYFNNHALPGSSLARDLARDARRICLDLEIALAGSLSGGGIFEHETTECFRAAMVLYAEATNMPLDPNLDRTWADGLSFDFSALVVGASIDLNTLLNRMFPTPSSRAIAGDNSFIRLQDALESSRDRCLDARSRFLAKGCVP